MRHTPACQQRLIGGALSTLAALALSASTLVSALAAPLPQTEPARSYIVVLRDDIDSDLVAREHGGRYGFEASYVYAHALKGYAGPLGAAAAERIRADARVQFVEESLRAPLDLEQGSALDGPSTQTAPTGVRRVGASTDGTTQTLANDGAGVGVAVIDTGVQLDHPDLTPVTSGKNCADPSKPVDDPVGHGTHVAGTIAARDNGFGVVGVAPGATIYPVKVIPNAGGWYPEMIVCGIDWVAANKDKIKVANMSLKKLVAAPPKPSNSNCTNPDNDSVHVAICKAVKAGVTFVVSAGNQSANANTQIPAAYEEVIAVSAWSDTNGGASAAGPTYTCPGWGMQTDETWATGTNYGPLVEIAAPGVGIKSTYKGSAYATYCGTSMAAPHVAGAAALVIQKVPSWNPQTVKVYLMWSASPLANTAQHDENLLKVSGY